MIAFIRKFFRAISYSIKWEKMFDLLAHKKYDEAYDRITVLEKVYPNYPMVFLLKARVLFKLGNNKDALSTLSNSLVLLENKNFKNNEEKKYLFLWAYLLNNKIDSSIDLFEGKYSPPSYFDVNLKLVSKGVKHEFPMRNHPDW